MAFTNTPFVDGNAITEADLKDRIDNFETWLNGGAAAGDVSHGEWVSKNHILRPEFALERLGIGFTGLTALARKCFMQKPGVEVAAPTMMSGSQLTG